MIYHGNSLVSSSLLVYGFDDVQIANRLGPHHSSLIASASTQTRTTHDGSLMDRRWYAIVRGK